MKKVIFGSSLMLSGMIGIAAEIISYGFAVSIQSTVILIVFIIMFLNGVVVALTGIIEK